LHAVAIGLLPVLLATGMALYWPPVHDVLIPYLPAIYDLHIGLGLAWLIIIVWPILIAPRFAGRRTLSVLDWLPLVALGVGAVVTGVVLVLPGVFSAGWRAIEFNGHGLFAILLALAVGGHALARWRRIVVRRSRFDAERRAFAGFALYGAAAAFALPWLGRLPTALAGGSASTGKASAAAIESDFITYSAAGTIPEIAPSAYRLRIDGAVQSPYELTLDELKAMPSVNIVKNFQCVTGWVVPSVHWTGVRLADLLARAGPKPGNTVVEFYSSDGVYTDTLSGEGQIGLGDVILAYAIEGGPLPAERGGPVRLVVPPMYGYKSVKWVDRIRVTDRVQPGYWEVRGYAVNAWLGVPPPPPPCGYGEGICN
jgi:DMSO/TMAO reductase YedYZ molybdopterin-dependent catalytic subunit